MACKVRPPKNQIFRTFICKLLYYIGEQKFFLLVFYHKYQGTAPVIGKNAWLKKIGQGLGKFKIKGLY